MTTPAPNTFPYPHRTVASVDADQRAKAKAKEYYARHVLRQIAAEDAAREAA